MDTKSHKIAGVGVLVALAMVLSYLELSLDYRMW